MDAAKEKLDVVLRLVAPLTSSFEPSAPPPARRSPLRVLMFVEARNIICGGDFMMLAHVLRTTAEVEPHSPVSQQIRCCGLDKMDFKHLIF